MEGGLKFNHDLAAMSVQHEDSEYVTESGGRDSVYAMQARQGISLTLLDCQSVRPRVQDWDTDRDTPGPDNAIRAYEVVAINISSFLLAYV
jgi:hypothetical protein